MALAMAEHGRVEREFRRMAAQQDDAACARRRLWRALQGRRLGGVEFLRRQPVGPYLVDVLAPELDLAVEVDEPRSLFAGDRDAQRQAHLTTFGVRSVRLKAEDVARDLDGCLRRVAEAIRTLRDLAA